ncbi:hypothetical protein VIGAN_03226600 [Vigna angularis var. angularis]|uniref:O-acyltransferase WSD1 C-terminal domain-containing protein n=1 Tax=Vigna angularis var. angularis TaxID=157739 RepID=A0A0S3RNY9_PHAAN|nr:hypothetical protein VIGAN_03226600 [Vigna angularis var. angularis]
MYKIMNNASLSISHMVGPAEKVTLADHPIEGFYFMTVGLSQKRKHESGQWLLSPASFLCWQSICAERTVGMLFCAGIPRVNGWKRYNKR